MDYIIIALLALVLVALIVLCILLASGSGKKQTDRIRRALEKEEREQAEKIDRALMNERQELTANISGVMASFGTLMSDSQDRFREQQDRTLSGFKKDVAERLEALERSNAEDLAAIREATEKRLNEMQKDNTERLEKMQKLVDDKLGATLENRIAQSFRLVSDQLEKVYKGLGEMQTVAGGVSDLKKVLSNVKTRGILGEVQLGSILEEILSPEQYSMNVRTKAGSNDPVEFAVKMPGTGDTPVYLPIDSKFPADTYMALSDAYEKGNPDEIKQAAAKMVSRLKSEAKDIRDKYVDPPNTTDFAVLFLPFEGLYAEAVNRGMVEELQREFKVNLAGPSTMAAFLNSLQMGFRTIAVQKRTAEVWRLLAEFKTEFARFQEVLDSSQKHLLQASGDLEKLIGVRTRSIEKKLNAVELFGLDLEEPVNEGENG